MEEKELRLVSPVLKEKQEKIAERLTEIYDALELLRQEAERLSDLWEGQAKNTFFRYLKKETGQMQESLKKISRQNELFILTENSMTDCENQIGELF